MVKSAYIHIPFCKSKCHYCSFVSYTDSSRKEEYLNSLAQEIKTYYDGEVLNTVYIGGGTPSILEVQDFYTLLSQLKVSSDSEITTELNPDDVSYDYMRELYDIGINRISFGCQTFNDEILKYINRRHTSEQVNDAVGFAKAAGFTNISLDFIYGLPKQTIDIFTDDLKRAAELDIPHISLYGLTLDKGSYFYENGYPNPDEDEQADMYLSAIEILAEFGYEHYEVSNFARKGYYSRHNMNYWNNEEYYGFGCAAHGYKNGIRYSNKTNLKEYIENPTEHESEKFVTQDEKLEEEIFLGLRKMEGIDVGEINAKYGINFEEKYGYILGKYEGLKLLEKTNKGYRLTPNGVLVSNTILAEFLD